MLEVLFIVMSRDMFDPSEPVKNYHVKQEISFVKVKNKLKLKLKLVQKIYVSALFLFIG